MPAAGRRYEPEARRSIFTRCPRRPINACGAIVTAHCFASRIRWRVCGSSTPCGMNSIASAHICGSNPPAADLRAASTPSLRRLAEGVLSQSRSVAAEYVLTRRCVQHNAPGREHRRAKGATRARGYSRTNRATFDKAEPVCVPRATRCGTPSLNYWQVIVAEIVLLFASAIAR